MREEIEKLIRQLSLCPGASNKEIDEMISGLGVALPKDYLSVLRLTNGAEGRLGKSSNSFIILLPVEEIVAANKEYEISEDYPELVVFGKNAATAGYAFDTRFSPMPVIEVDLIDPDYRKSVGANFADFLITLASQ